MAVAISKRQATQNEKLRRLVKLIAFLMTIDDLVVIRSSLEGIIETITEELIRE